MEKSLESKVRNRKSGRVKAAGVSAFFALSFVFISVASAVQAIPEPEESPLREYLWPIINFLVLIFLLVYMMKKMDIKGYFKKRTELIEQSLKEAREAKELAQKALVEVEERLKMKDREIEEIVAAAKQSGEKEKARMLEEGQRMKEKILEQAKTNIDYEVKRAKESIKEEAVEVAMGLAEKKLKDKLTPEEQMKLLEESVAKIEGKN